MKYTQRQRRVFEADSSSGRKQGIIERASSIVQSSLDRPMWRSLEVRVRPHLDWAVIALLGDNINRLSVPFFSRGRERDEERGFWAGWARLVMAHPWPGVIGASVLMLTLAAPVLAINLGFSGVSTLPEDETVSRAFRILDDQFSAGRSQPTEIVVLAEDVTRPEITAAIERLDAAAGGNEPTQRIQQLYRRIPGHDPTRDDPANGPALVTQQTAGTPPPTISAADASWQVRSERRRVGEKG